MPTSATATSRRERRPRLTLCLQIAPRGIRAPTERQVRRWAGAALTTAGDITVRIVGAAEGRRLNSRYRGETHATNVLSFPYGTTRGSIVGDIVLCAPVISREARAQGKTEEAHYAHLTVHAVLHLQGYDHRRRRDAERMEALEKKLLTKLGYPDPYEAST
ncbi:MAG TPA: rRNA maturation RNase YbeY [Burkholderiales bacterium]|nr:rRNA maturation RNase YbeY [Burkholderiales bacterium]